MWYDVHMNKDERSPADIARAAGIDPDDPNVFGCDGCGTLTPDAQPDPEGRMLLCPTCHADL